MSAWDVYWLSPVPVSDAREKPDESNYSGCERLGLDARAALQQSYDRSAG